MGFPGGSDCKESACNTGNLSLIPGSGRSPGEGNDNPFQHSCLENPIDRGTWLSTVHGVAKSWTRLSDFTFTFKLLYYFYHLSFSETIYFTHSILYLLNQFHKINTRSVPSILYSQHYNCVIMSQY